MHRLHTVVPRFFFDYPKTNCTYIRYSNFKNLGNTEYWLYLGWTLLSNLNEKDMSSKKTKPMFMWKRIFMWRWTNLLHIRQTHFKTFGPWCISGVCLAMKSSNLVVYFFYSLFVKRQSLKKKTDKSSFVWFCSFTYERWKPFVRKSWKKNEIPGWSCQ